jgi:hypothetical protein
MINPVTLTGAGFLHYPALGPVRADAPETTGNRYMKSVVFLTVCEAGLAVGSFSFLPVQAAQKTVQGMARGFFPHLLAACL